MKRIISLALTLLLLLALSVCAFAESKNISCVYDEAGLLSESEENRLEEKISSISEEYKIQITVITREELNYSSIESLANNFFDNRELGYGDTDDGVLLIMTMDTRDYYILCSGKGAEAISPNDRENIADEIVPDLSDGEYYNAFSAFADECEYYFEGELNGYPFDFKTNIITALIIGIIIGVVVALILKSQLKSRRKQNYAQEYIIDGSFRLTLARDYFLYRHVSRTAKPDSSSSGGSSRHGGGGKF